MASGKNSQKTKQDYIVSLLANSKGNETGYIMRSLQVGIALVGVWGFGLCVGPGSVKASSGKVRQR